MSTKIQVRTLDGKTAEYIIAPTESVGTLRSRIASKLHASPSQIKLTHGGAILGDDSDPRRICATPPSFLVLLRTSPVLPRRKRKLESSPVGRKRARPYTETLSRLTGKLGVPLEFDRGSVPEGDEEGGIVFLSIRLMKNDK